jgi:hypothetical protein
MQGLILFTERVGNMMSRLLLTVLYYVVLGPFAIFYKIFADPLHLRARQTNWVAWDRTQNDLRSARKQD